MSKVLEEAYDLVGEGDLSEDDFKSFAFGNAARLHTALNPNIFIGAVVEPAVSDILADN
jgi:hypothetical protein